MNFHHMLSQACPGVAQARMIPSCVPRLSCCMLLPQLMLQKPSAKCHTMSTARTGLNGRPWLGAGSAGRRPPPVHRGVEAHKNLQPNATSDCTCHRGRSKSVQLRQRRPFISNVRAKSRTHAHIHTHTHPCVLTVVCLGGDVLAHFEGNGIVHTLPKALKLGNAYQH